MDDDFDDCDLDDDEEGGTGNITNFDNTSQTKILIVDDEEFTRALIKNLFTQICSDKIECVEARDGAEAVSKVKGYGDDNPFILVFMDLNMPVMDGFESSKQIMEFAGGHKVVPKVYGLTSYSPGELEILMA